MIYLDNAATSFPKPKSVIEEVKRCISTYCGNPGRSSHNMSLTALEKIYETREEIADFLSFDKPENIVFTQNATHALNLAIKTQITENCHIIISDMEHNSVIRPLYKVAKLYGSEISIYNTDIPINEAIIPLIRSNTKFIITSLSSNVTGKTVNVHALSKIALQRGIKLIVDASQYIGHLPFSIKECPVDILCAPGHKALFGIQGSGFVLFKSTKAYETLLEGGSGSDSFNLDMPKTLPERLEAGTLNTPAIVSLCEGIRYLKQFGLDNVKHRIELLTDRLKSILDQPDIISYGCENGIAAFRKARISPEEIAYRLNLSGIAVRSGIHCAPLIHKKLGTVNGGLVRVSLSIMNTEKQLDKLYSELKTITK